MKIKTLLIEKMGCHKLTYNHNFTTLKELQDKKTLPLKMGAKLDYFGARYYDSEISIWLSVDTLAFKYPSQSPYSFVGNRPINTIDPWGMDEVKGKIKIRKTRKSDIEGKSRYRFRNTRTKERGWIYAPGNKSSKEVANDLKNGTAANYDIHTYSKKGEHVSTVF